MYIQDRIIIKEISRKTIKKIENVISKMISSHNKAVEIPWFLRKSETSSNYTRSQWIETISEEVFLS